MTEPESLAGSIAIVGLAGRFPSARNVAEFWRNLVEGRDCITQLSDEQLAASGYDPVKVRALPGYVAARGLIEKPEWFDAAFFGITPREAAVIDPQQRVFLEIAWDALEDAGCDPSRYAGLIGVFGSLTNNTYYQHFVRHRRDLLEAVGTTTAVLANEKDFLATRVAYKLDLRGPALNIQTACSSSLVAVCTAVQNLLAYQCDAAIAGGVSITFPQERGYFYNEGAMTSIDGRCAPFDASASGTVFSSGAGVVILKRLADALAEGDQIYAVIRGTALNNDGGKKVSFAAPSVDGHSEVIALAQAVAGITPDTISYVETHGTGTPLGDPIEIAGLTQVFGAATGAKQTIPVGSVKGNIGHLDAASGVVGLIKTALALKHGQIPASLHFDQPNPALHLEDSPFFVNTELRAWPRGNEPRRAGVSSFGVGGTNAHVVLEEAPAQPGVTETAEAQTLVLSAKTATALDQRASDLAAFLEANPSAPLADVAYTLQVGRQRFAHRRVVVARTAAEAIDALRKPTRLQRQDDRSDTHVAFVFPGQGAQYAQMGAQLHRHECAFRDALDEVAAALQPELGLDLRELLFSTDESATERLRETRLTQPAIFAVDYALGRLWLSLGVEPAALLGHSVGEFAAAALAGIFSVADAAKLVATRARLVNELPGGAMLALRLGEAEVQEFLADPQLSLAAVNSPKLCVLSGPFDAIEKLEVTCTARNIAARRLATSHAFHSAMVEPVVEPFAAAVAAVKLHPPTLPIVSSATGDWLTDAQATDPRYWATHLRATVRFADGVGRLLDDRGLTLLEAGPGQTLTQLARQHAARTARHEVVHTIAEGTDEELSLATAVGQLWLAGTAIDWTRIHGSDTRRRISLPSYPFERQRYFADLPAGTPLPLATSVTDGEPPLEALPAITAHALADSDAAPAISVAAEEPPAASMLDQVRTVISDLSGQNIMAAPGDTGFLELGFDSLFLSQAAITLTRKFGTKITFRQLLRDTSNLQALADFLEANATKKNVGEKSQPANHGNDSNQSSSHSRHSSDSRANASAAPAAHGPFRPVVRELSTALTEKQERWIAEFIERYVAQFAKSKAHTQQYRAVLADPRAVSGFKQVWKEMIFPIVVERSAGARLWDIDGHEWLDITLAFGAAMLGHQPPYAIEAMKRQMDLGMEIGPTSPLAGEVAQMLCERTGMERVTFCNTGSEAITGALRVARTVSGKPLIVYFSGSYHGIDNEALGHRTNSDAAVPIAPGITPEALANTLIFDYGDPRALEQIAARADDIAAVLVEPVQSRRPGFQPREFLHELRAVTQQHGVALIFDEVVTGFRCHPGGAQAYFGIKADLATYGKIIGGGISVGVIAGRAEYMDAFDGGHWQFGDDSFPEAAVTFFAGTFVRHPMALAAVKAVLLHLDQQGPELQATLARRADAMVAQIGEIFDGTPFTAKNFTSNWYIHIAPDFKYGPLFYALMRLRGIHVWEARPCFVSTEHCEADLDRVVETIRETVAELESGGFFIREKNDAPPGADTIPTTESQREMLFVCQHDPTGSMAYNETWTLRLTGEFDLAAFRAAAQTVIDRHDALRATVTPSGERLVIAATLNVEVPLTDLSALPPAERATQLAALREAESTRIFDLQRGPLVVLQIVKLAEREHAFLFNAHHLTCDGWSCDVLLNELAAIYNARRRGTPHGLPAPMQMRDYEKWEVAMRAGSEFAEDRAYWLDRYQTIPPELTLPGDRPHPRRRSYRGSAEEVTLPAAWTAPIAKLGADHGATFFAVLFAGFQTVLFRLTGQTDLTVGIPSAGQNLVEGENLIGHCVNLLPLRTQFAADATFLELLAAVQTTVLEGFEHQRLTFGTLLQSLTVPRTPGRVPLVPVTFNLDPPLSHIAFDGLAYAFENNPRAAFQFDLGINLDTSGGGFRIVCKYSTDLFDAATVQRWMDHFREVLEAAAAHPHQPLRAFLPQLDTAGQSAAAPPPDLTAAARPRVPLAWNDTARPFPADRAIHQLFEAQAAARPDAVALAADAARLSYRELNERANRLARQLVELGIVRGSCVGICAERSPEFIIGVLAIAKAGGAYVPIDPAYPADRLAQMLSAARPPLILTRGSVNPAIISSGARLLALESISLTTGDASNLDTAVTGDDVAYVMFTSGSTGVPKGVIVPHCAINRLVINNDFAPFAATDVVAFASNVCFDAATLEIWGALLNGGTLAVTPQDVLLSPTALAAHLAQHRVSVLFLTTSLFNRLVHADPAMFRDLRHLIFGGEAADATSVRLVLENGKPERLVNGYGPTETTTFAICHQCTAADAAGIPIGRPIANTTVHLLDAARQPVAVGETGEIFIGGPGVAHGYVHDATLTAERFVTTGFGRLYKTGDLAKWRTDGVLEYLGRADSQIKLRGFRIEPGEIEAALQRHPGVRQAAVIARENGGDKELAAYLVRQPAAAPTGAELRAFLTPLLPAPMIPQSFVWLEALPLTPNGKLDHQALPAPESVAASEAASHVPPRNAVERSIAELWHGVLGRNSFSVRDDFFAIGGHSLLAIQVISGLRQKFGVDVPVRRLFDTPTIEGLAEFITAHLPPPPPAKALRSLIAIQRGDAAKRPLFLVPGGWGAEVEFLVYAQLKLHLGADLPIYGLKARGFDGVEAPHRSVAEMVVDYVDEMRSKQPHGPYLLAGECIGGVVAYEMARRLEELGEDVELLALLDTARPSQAALREFCAEERADRWQGFWKVHVFQPFHDHRQNLARLPLTAKLGYVWRRMTRKRRLGPGAVPTPLDTRKVLAHYPRLLMAHPVGAYRGKVTLLIDETSHRDEGHLGWDDVQTGGLEIHVLPGDHLSYIREYAATAAAKLRELIERSVKIST